MDLKHKRYLEEEVNKLFKEFSKQANLDERKVPNPKYYGIIGKVSDTSTYGKLYDKFFDNPYGISSKYNIIIENQPKMQQYPYPTCRQHTSILL